MKTLVFVLLSLCAFYAVEGQLCGGRELYDAEELCPFPGGKSCCSPAELSNLRLYLDTITGTLPKGCYEYFRGLVCAGCDPLSRGDEIICKSFCEQFVKSCFKDLMKYIPDFDDEICGDYPETNCFRGFDFEPLPPRSVCGQFGDPHVRLFSGQFKTCKALGKAKMFKSKHLEIIATNVEVHSSGATITKELEVKYKGTTLHFSVNSGIYPIPSVSSDVIGSFSYLGGRTYLFHDIDTRLSVTYGINEIFFTLSSPEEGESGQICKSGCDDEIDIVQALSDNPKRSDAEEACKAAGLEKGTYHYDACVFDVSVTGDESYALSVAKYSELESDALVEEEYRRKSSSLNMVVNIFMLVILSLISLIKF